MEELKINEIIDLFKKANFHIDLCMGRSNGKHEFSKINKAMKQIPDLLEELKKYRVKEEQGLLLRLPCKVGTNIYIVNHWWIDEGHICGISECDDTDCACFKVYEDPDTYTIVSFDEFGETWFLTREEAEVALKKIQEGE